MSCKVGHSIVLMEVCDANYRFIMVDIGDTGRQIDGSIYNNGNIGYAIENNLLGIPKDSRLKNCSCILPCVFLAYDASRLKHHTHQQVLGQKNILSITG